MTNNLPPFYVGQKVVYITGINMKKDTVWTVLDIQKAACKCGEWEIKIAYNSQRGLRDYPQNVKKLQCASCYTIYPRDLNAGYWQATSFRPLTSKKMHLVTYSKVLEEIEISSN